MSLTLNNISRNTSRISIKYGDLHTVMDWCKNICMGEWYITDHFDAASFDLQNGFNIYEFQFNDDRDLMLFELTWK